MSWPLLSRVDCVTTLQNLTQLRQHLGKASPTPYLITVQGVLLGYVIFVLYILTVLKARYNNIPWRRESSTDDSVILSSSFAQYFQAGVVFLIYKVSSLLGMASYDSSESGSSFTSFMGIRASTSWVQEPTATLVKPTYYSTLGVRESPKTWDKPRYIIASGVRTPITSLINPTAIKRVSTVVTTASGDVCTEPRLVLSRKETMEMSGDTEKATEHNSSALAATTADLSTEAITVDLRTEATTVDPTTEATTVDPTTEATTVDPTTGATTVDPTTGATTVDPTTGATTVDLRTEATTVDPTAEATTVDPTAEATTVDPTTGATTVDLRTEATTVDPAAEATTGATTVDLRTEGTTVDPTTEATTVDPTTEATTVDPTTGATTVDPTTGATTVDPTTGATTVDPTTGATTVDLRTEATTVDPTAEATTVDPTTGATTVDPTTGATTVDLRTEATTVDPTAEATTVDPTTRATTVDPTTGATTVDLRTEGTTVDPTTEATTIDPTTGATTVDLRTEATTVDPTTEATTVDLPPEATADFCVDAAINKVANATAMLLDMAVPLMSSPRDFINCEVFRNMFSLATDIERGLSNLNQPLVTSHTDTSLNEDNIFIKFSNAVMMLVRFMDKITVDGCTALDVTRPDLLSVALDIEQGIDRLRKYLEFVNDEMENADLSVEAATADDLSAEAATADDLSAEAATADDLSAEDVKFVMGYVRSLLKDLGAPVDVARAALVALASKTELYLEDDIRSSDLFSGHPTYIS
ncbi:uncharacterized protein [Cherax quadricarinatus]|uniref:uncharacterized protein n=1 Tax=Cherax quadricarinatus TaxID=27406 RepID=UPI00387E7EE7